MGSEAFSVVLLGSRPPRAEARHLGAVRTAMSNGGAPVGEPCWAAGTWQCVCVCVCARACVRACVLFGDAVCADSHVSS